MNELLKLTIDNNMSIYKTAYDEGYKMGYAEGKREVWAEMQKTIDGLLNKCQEIVQEIVGVKK